MANTNGTNQTADIIAHARSVKRDDFARGSTTVVFPAYGYDSYYKRFPTLPKTLPPYTRWSFYRKRDWTLLATIRHEALWANAVSIATTKAAAWGWNVSGSVALRRKRLHELLNYATAGVFVGWVPFIASHIRSFLLTGLAFVEIERQTGAPGSRISGLHHLNPLRCRLTDNAREPVEYLDRRGRVHRLKFWQVMMFADGLDPTEGELSMSESAAERVYTRIATTEAAQRYLYEKLTGSRALSIEFIQGITKTALDDSLRDSAAQQERSDNYLYKGIMAIPIPGDVPIQRVSVPIAELPDGFDAPFIYDSANVAYAGALGLTFSDLDGRRAGSLVGGGAQEVVLAEKVKGRGLVAWKSDWANQTHRLVAGAATTFAWSEDTLDDDLKKAELSSRRAAVRKAMQDANEITADQSRNLAVDDGELPREYLQTEDETAVGTLESDERPLETEKAANPDLADVIRKEIENAQSIVTGKRQNLDKVTA